MPVPIPQFKIRKLRGVVEINMPDDPAFRSELARGFPNYAPLLAEPSGASPTFEQLKSTREATDFLEASNGNGTAYSVTLIVRGLGNVILEKEALFIDEGKKVRAISSWSEGGGYSFRITN